MPLKDLRSNQMVKIEVGDSLLDVDGTVGRPVGVCAFVRVCVCVRARACANVRACILRLHACTYSCISIAGDGGQRP